LTNSAEKLAHSLVDTDVASKMREAKGIIGIGKNIEPFLQMDSPLHRSLIQIDLVFRVP
jgi:hypothetical protein